MEYRYKIQGDNTINIHENYEVEYWAKQLNIRPSTLREIVVKAGPSLNAIRKYLKG
mgnify:CR=1 FL=1